MDDGFTRFKYIIFLILILYHAPAHLLQSRSVNLALETSFLFDPQDIKANATFISQVQDVLDKLKLVLDHKGASQGSVFRHHDRPSTTDTSNNVLNDTNEADNNVLTNFLSEIGSELIKFDDDNIKKFSRDLKEAVYEISETNKQFDEMFNDNSLANFILNTVKIWSETDPMVLKLEIAKYIINVDTDSVIELFKIVNRVFDATDVPKLKKLRKQFTKSLKTDDYKNFLIKTIDFIVFERYGRLNFLLKHIVQEELNKFSTYVSKNYNERVKDSKTFEFIENS